LKETRTPFYSKDHKCVVIRESESKLKMVSKEIGNESKVVTIEREIVGTQMVTVSFYSIS
jgi:hypothetical protein